MESYGVRERRGVYLAGIYAEYVIGSLSRLRMEGGSPAEASQFFVCCKDLLFLCAPPDVRTGDGERTGVLFYEKLCPGVR